MMRDRRPQRLRGEVAVKGDNFEEQCPECGGDIVVDSGNTERYCEDCFLCQGNVFVATPATVAQTDDRDSANWRWKAASSVTRDKGLGSSIKTSSYESNSSKACALTRTERKHVIDSKERTLENSLREIRRLANRLNLPPVVQTDAATYFHKASEADLLHGRAVESYTGATVYAAAYAHGQPRTYEEIAEVSGSECSVDDIKGAHQRLLGEEGVELERPAPNQWPRFGPLPEDFLPRFSTAVGDNLDTANVDGSVPRIQLETRARATLQSALTVDDQLSNRVAKTLAAAAIYVAGDSVGLPITQADVAAATPVSKFAIGDVSREMRAALEMNGQSQTSVA